MEGHVVHYAEDALAGSSAHADLDEMLEFAFDNCGRHPNHREDIGDTMNEKLRDRSLTARDDNREKALLIHEQKKPTAGGWDQIDVPIPQRAGSGPCIMDGPDSQSFGCSRRTPKNDHV